MLTDSERDMIEDQRRALGSFAAEFLAANSPKPKRRKRRLSYREALRAAEIERKRMTVFGHYGQ